MKNLKILKPNISDYDIIIQLINESDKQYNLIYTKQEQKDFEIGMWKYEDLQNRNMLILKNNNEIIGYLDYKIKSKTSIWLNNFYIKSEYKGHGIGSIFLKLFFDYIFKLGFIDIALETEPKALWANKFYKKNGFALLDINKFNQYPLNIFFKKPPVKNRNIYYLSLN